MKPIARSGIREAVRGKRRLRGVGVMKQVSFKTSMKLRRRKSKRATKSSFSETSELAHICWQLIPNDRSMMRKRSFSNFESRDDRRPT
jgi:hypothetical protein